MESEQISLKIKYNEGQNEIAVTMSLSETVSQLKEKCQETGFQPNEMKFIYKGRVLKEAEMLKDKNIQNNDTLYLYKAKNQEPAQPQQQVQEQKDIQQQKPGQVNFGQVMSQMQQEGMMPNLGGMNMDFGFISTMLKNPMMKSMMQSIMSNPAIMQMAINMNPALKSMVEQNPGMLEMMTNPEIMGQAFSMLETMGNQAPQQDKQGQDPQVAPQIPGLQIPQGQNLFQMMQQKLQGLQPAQQTQQQNQNQSQQQNQQEQQQNQESISNLQQQEEFEPEDILEDENQEEKVLLDQLARLNEMGFENINDNLAALKDANGDLDIAVQKLFEKSGQQ